MVISESDLLQRARQFDRQALGEIYDRYSPRLYRYAARLLGNPDLAEDCVADVFSRFLHALEKGNGPRDYMQAYLYRIAHNWITDHWRAKPPPAVVLDDEWQAGINSDPAHTLLAQIEQAQVRAALAQLTPEQRQVIVLKFIEGLDNDHVAAALGKPISAIKSLQHRALGALRRNLTQAEQPYEPTI